MCVFMCTWVRVRACVWERERGATRPGFVFFRRLLGFYDRDASISEHGSFEKEIMSLRGTSTTSESLDSTGLDTEIPAAARRSYSTRGSQKWSNVRAVMALYSSLRKIKRYSRHCSIWTVTSTIGTLSSSYTYIDLSLTTHYSLFKFSFTGIVNNWFIFLFFFLFFILYAELN